MTQERREAAMQVHDRHRPGCSGGAPDAGGSSATLRGSIHRRRIQRTAPRSASARNSRFPIPCGDPEAAGPMADRDLAEPGAVPAHQRGEEAVHAVEERQVVENSRRYALSEQPTSVIASPVARLRTALAIRERRRTQLSCRCWRTPERSRSRPQRGGRAGAECRPGRSADRRRGSRSPPPRGAETARERRGLAGVPAMGEAAAGDRPPRAHASPQANRPASRRRRGGDQVSASGASAVRISSTSRGRLPSSSNTGTTRREVGGGGHEVAAARTAGRSGV